MRKCVTHLFLGLLMSCLINILPGSFFTFLWLSLVSLANHCWETKYSTMRNIQLENRPNTVALHRSPSLGQPWLHSTTGTFQWLHHFPDPVGAWFAFRQQATMVGERKRYTAEVSPNQVYCPTEQNNHRARFSHSRVPGPLGTVTFIWGWIIGRGFSRDPINCNRGVAQNITDRHSN